VRQLFSNTQAVGAAFGVILVRHRKSVVEVATFRTDGTYSDGRRPDAVTFTTAEEDAKRRDFTINGLFLDPIENRVIDYVGGQEDLKKQVLRAIGDPDRRFEEDHLRLLRAIRFASRFYLAIDAATGEAIARHAPQLTRISPERVAEELRLMLAPATRCDAWVRLSKFGIDDVIFRHWPIHDRSDGSGKVNLVMCKLGDERAGLGLVLAAAMIARWTKHDTEEDLRRCFERQSAAAAVGAMRRALRISNSESDEMQGVLIDLGVLLDAAEPTLAQKKRFLARATARSSLRLMRAVGASGFFMERARQLDRELTDLANTEFAPPPLITGDDLTDAGLMPGPRFKVALEHTYDAQLEGRVTSRKQALEMAIGIAKGEQT
jgi:poly(A) polymerase